MGGIEPPSTAYETIVMNRYTTAASNSCNILEKYIYGLEPSPRALQARALTN